MPLEQLLDETLRRLRSRSQIDRFELGDQRWTRGCIGNNPPQRTSGSRLHTSNGEQFSMISGFVILELADDSNVLRRGDAITTQPSRHRWENKEPRTCNC